jgi:hypothetical protein
MHVPSWLIVSAAVVAAIPFGWMLGVLAAEAIVGREMGVFPVLTIPFGLIAAIVFAVSPIANPAVRLLLMIVGTAALALFL